MKQAYEEMEVNFVGSLNNVVNKSGPDDDLSTQFEQKSQDEDQRPS